MAIAGEELVDLEPLTIAAIDIVWVVVALGALLILFAFWLVLYVLNAMLGSISFFGFHPFNFALDLVKTGMKKSVGLLDSKVSAFAEFLWGIIMTVWRFAYVVTDTVVVLWWRDIVHQQQASTANANETARAQFIEGQLRTQEAADKAQLVNQEAIDVGRLTQQAIDNQGALQTQLDNLTAILNADIAQVNGRLNSLTVPDISQLQTQINNIGSQLAAQQQTLTETINVTIPRDVQDLTQQIGAGVSSADAFALGAIATATPGIVARAVAQLQPTISNIETDIGECLDPLCDTVTPNASQLGDLGKLLKALEDLFGVAVLTGLLVAAVEDPKGTATAVVDVAGWMANAGQEMAVAIGDLAGVQL